MIAARIVTDIREAGATITAADGRLHIDAPDGVLTAGRKAALKGHKAAILAFLAFLAYDDNPLTGALTTAAAGLNITATECYEALAPEDVAAWQAGEIGQQALTAFALVLHDGRERAAGRVPDNYEEIATCAHCGPIWLFTAGDVASCVWCANRINGQPIPRPHAVTCGTCRHFKRSEHPNLGRCAVGVRAYAPAGLWDTNKHACTRWLPVA